MSIPYRKLFNKAMEYYPQVPIKDGNTWIAILVHSITRIGDIDERNYFLWLKCHNAITIRTLKHEYFARHPLEDFELKFRGDFLEETLQIRHLRAKQRTRYKDQHHVIVLRAFEVKDILEEEEGDEIRRIEKQVRAQKDRGKHRNDAIIIDEDADSDNYMAATSEDESDDDVIVWHGHGKKRKHSSKSSQKSQRSTSSGKEEAEIEYVDNLLERDSNARRFCNENGSQHKAEDSQDSDSQDEEAHSEDSQDEQAQNEDEDDAEHSTKSSQTGRSPNVLNNDHSDKSLDGQRQWKNSRENSPPWDESGDVADDDSKYGLDKSDAVEIEYSTTHFDEAMDFTRDRTWDGFYARLAALPELSDQLDVEKQFECEFCGKHMFVKPWTHFGQRNTPICSKCTRMMLEGTKDHSMLEEMRRLVNEELEEKHSRMTNSVNEEASAQNLDEDAPFDYASELAAPGHVNDNIIAESGYEHEKDSNAQFQQDAEFRDSKSSSSEENGAPDSSDTSNEHENDNDSSDEQSSPDTVVNQAESDGYSTEPESLTSRTKALPTKHRSRNKKVVEETDSSEDDDSTYSSGDESMDDDD